MCMQTIKKSGPSRFGTKYRRCSTKSTEKLKPSSSPPSSSLFNNATNRLLPEFRLVQALVSIYPFFYIISLSPPRTSFFSFCSVLPFQHQDAGFPIFCKPLFSAYCFHFQFRPFKVSTSAVMDGVVLNNNGTQDLNQKVLTTLANCKHLKHLKQLQSYLITLGHGQTQFFAFKLVRFCLISLSNLDYARLIFNQLSPNPNVYLYTAMITSYSSSRPNSSLELYRDMLRRGRPKPNHFIYPHVLKCSSAIKMLHTQVLKSGYGYYSVVQTALLDSYLKGGDCLVARQLFDEMSERNVVSWTAMIYGYMKLGQMGNALLLFEDMPGRDVPSWNAVIAGCTQNGLFSEAISLFTRMIVHHPPNNITVVCVLSACGHRGMLRLGRAIHGYIYRKELGILNTFIVNALVDMYGKCGSLKEARYIFYQTPLEERSLTSWNSMINCLALHGQSESAIDIFKEMERGSVVRPDEVTFVGLLNACTHGGLVNQGCEYFSSMTRDYDIEPQIEHYGCVIDLLGRAGQFDEAMQMIKGMRMEPDEVVWGSLLNGSKIHGRMDLAAFAVDRLIEINPNNAGYGIMLANISGELGNWDEVRKVRKILKDRGVQKTPGCSWIEVDKEVHQFYSMDKMHPGTEEIYKILDNLLGSV